MICILFSLARRRGLGGVGGGGRGWRESRALAPWGRQAGTGLFLFPHPLAAALPLVLGSRFPPPLPGSAAVGPGAFPFRNGRGNLNLSAPASPPRPGKKKKKKKKRKQCPVAGKEGPARCGVCTRRSGSLSASLGSFRCFSSWSTSAASLSSCRFQDAQIVRQS